MNKKILYPSAMFVPEITSLTLLGILLSRPDPRIPFAVDFGLNHRGETNVCLPFAVAHASFIFRPLSWNMARFYEPVCIYTFSQHMLHQTALVGFARTSEDRRCLLD